MDLFEKRLWPFSFQREWRLLPVFVFLVCDSVEQSRKNSWHASGMDIKGNSAMSSVTSAQSRRPSEPVTLAVVGCGQRGKVHLFSLVTTSLTGSDLFLFRHIPNTPSKVQNAAKSSLLQNHVRKHRNTLQDVTVSTRPSSSQHGKIYTLPLQRPLVSLVNVSQMPLSLLCRIICISKSLWHLLSKDTTFFARSPWPQA